MNDLYGCVVPPTEVVDSCNLKCKKLGYLSGRCSTPGPIPSPPCKENEIEIDTEGTDCGFYIGVGTCCCFPKPEENLPPVIEGVSGPTQLKVNETGTWTIKAHDPEGGYLYYSVDWGDETKLAEESLETTAEVTQTTTFTHSYSKEGNYTITFLVKDDKGNEAKSTISVKVTKEETCHTTPLWSWEYCTPGCKCNIGEGDCDTDADCFTGYCAQNVGEKYGQVPEMDVCEEKEITCTDSDGGKNYYEKGTVEENGKKYTDYCVNESTLKEYHCLPYSPAGLGGVAQEDYQCPYGCKDGACQSGI